MVRHGPDRSAGTILIRDSSQSPAEVPGMQALYGTKLDETLPVQRLAQHLLQVGTSGWFVQVLHRYIFNASQPMPDRLRQLLIENGCEQMESAIALDSEPELSPWSWYRGAISQFHAAVFLLREVCAYPGRKDAGRIWESLNYIFNVSDSVSRIRKGQMVLVDLRDRMKTYHAMRKLKLTIQMEERLTSMGDDLGCSAVQHDIEAGVAPTRIFQEPWRSDEREVNKILRTETSLGAASMVNDGPQTVSVSLGADILGENGIASAGESGQQSIVSDGGDGYFIMEDIDWTEWEKYFPTGDDEEDHNVPT